MWVRYAEQIQKSPAALTIWEQCLRGQRVADRVRRLRLLKRGEAQSCGRLGELLG
jgi:hypothetical protein